MVSAIRPARPDDLPLLGRIELAAGAAFRDVGMATVADGEPMSVAELSTFERDGRAWVATDDADVPIGYVVAVELEGGAHVEQVSVHPDHAGQRIGSALIDAVEAWADARGLAVLTLTTFVHVPWNAPYYERLGFAIQPTDQLSPGLRRVRADEAARGLDRWPRVAMRRRVGSRA